MSLEILFILLLILANGLFAMAELAMLSARKSHLAQKAEAGDKNARKALELAENPSRFLSTVQIGITTVGIFAGAFGGATLTRGLSAFIKQTPVLIPYADAAAVTIVVLAITFLTLIVGELVPKQIGLNHAEQIAVRLAYPMDTLSKVFAPIVQVLSWSSAIVLRLLNQKSRKVAAITEEEVNHILSQATLEGVFEPEERSMVEQIFRLGDLKINAFITPRTNIIWLDLEDNLETNLEIIGKHNYDCYPVAQGGLDNVIGLIFAKDLLNQSIHQKEFHLQAVVRPALFIPENLPALDMIQRFREHQAHVALVIDEYGGIQGLVTINDIMELVISDFPGVNLERESEIVEREDGSWLVDGKILIDEFLDFFDIDAIPEEHEGAYQTLGGFVMTMLGQIPNTGDSFIWEGYQFEVVDMDGRRVDKIIISRHQS